MKKVFILNGHQYHEGIAEGKLTQKFIDIAKDFFLKNGFEIKQTNIEKGYEEKEELEKLSWADYILFQYPIFWSLPWLTKKYIDEIFEAGRGTVTYINDGRSKNDASKKYGSGGLMKDKKYMLSHTYNCPANEFNNKDGFFEGMSVDQANFSTHYIFKFCGAQQLETFSVHDIFKGDMNLDKELEKFKRVLAKNFL